MDKKQLYNNIQEQQQQVNVPLHKMLLLWATSIL